MSKPLQCTIKKPVSLKGISLHTGLEINLTFKPAPENSGFIFQRIDLPDQPVINASADKVKTVERCTTIAEGTIKIHTIEHVLSALSGMGIDNVLIEIDSNETPICDGSAKPYVELIKQAGIEEQTIAKKIYSITEPLHYENKNGTQIVVLPSAEFKISVTQVGPKGKMTEFFSSVITPETYETEIAPARTFTFSEDIQPLLDKGLIKGGSLENAIVIRGDEVLSKSALRFDNELARHKALDIIGDLALSGIRITGHVIAIKPGHQPNTQVALKIAKEYQNKLTQFSPSPIPNNQDFLNVEDVQKTLIHRYPFLLIDRFLVHDETKARAIKNVTINEPFFQGHFPGKPVMPGVLQIEAMAQASSILVFRQGNFTGKIGYLVAVDKAKFRQPVVPGDVLVIEIELINFKRFFGTTQCKCLVNGKEVSSCTLKFAIA